MDIRVFLYLFICTFIYLYIIYWYLTVTRISDANTVRLITWEYSMIFVLTLREPNLL